MRSSCRVDIVYGFAYPVQRSWCPNSKICHGHIIIYGTHEPDDPQMTMLGCLLFSDLAYSPIRVRCKTINALLYHLEHASL
jgi:hypothetical protein